MAMQHSSVINQYSWIVEKRTFMLSCIDTAGLQPEATIGI
jgi:hypothetical protein